MISRGMTAIAALLWAAGACAAADAMHARSRTYGAVRLSYDDLASLIQRIRVQTSSASASYHPSYTYPSERLEVKRGDEGLKLPTGFSTDALSRAPNDANFIFYMYEFRDAPIASVNVWMTDSYRKVEVEGAVVEQVEGLSAIIDDQLGRLETPLGGPNFRFLMGAILLVVSILLVVVAKEADLDPRPTLFLWGVSLLLVLTVFLLPWDRWMPGVALMRGDLNPVRRYNAELSLVLGVLGLAGMVGGMVRLTRRRLARSPQSPQETAPAPEAKAPPDSGPSQ